MRQSILPKLFTAVMLLFGLTAPSAFAQVDAETAPIRTADEQFVKAFNAGKAEELAAMFLDKGELVDEHGTVHQGQQQIKDLLALFFAKFPGVKLALDVDSIRVIGPVAIEEGTRHTATNDETNRSQMRYITVRTKVGNNWPIVSLREISEEPPATPHEHLQVLSWLVGDWINESSDAVVKISYRWSDDKNFLLGDFEITRHGSVVMKSTQRIAWDPLAGKFRSWMFDSDGGYADGNWTYIGDAWVVKSTAVMPDGHTGSATVTFKPKDANSFTMTGTDRIVGHARDDDFNVTVTRPAPVPGK
jgi:uncharacterized protein (TIGR02246 family)